MAKRDWNPTMGHDEAAEDPDRLLREDFMPPEGGGLWTPSADMIESRCSFHILVEVPGMRLEDIAVELKGRELVVCGRRRFERDSCDNVYHLLERQYGPFLRRFPLPKDIDRRSITARIQDGMLTISIAKRFCRKRTIRVG